ncbi:acetyl-CoA carboxylase biotin carboxyl carrier protein [Paraburkholderia sp. 1N]|uniref:Biotin carboxyl carrier protein of acetyl-CoA carboxylase n=1 Tax=Paraburkholderia solitsugae TaxID=2675748 RepID=A0ABX2BYH4_9BURK|nr:biotin/lipoyl-containing protein [Paraburkholderia solitsugae]NPT44667.1 acetyl-CoA carboxylase biotin carboxyl carrier protein [Paraburkholderia solitsugae]
MSLTHTDVTRILELLDRAAELDSLEVKLGDFVVQASKPGAVAPDSAAVFQPAASASPAATLVTPNAAPPAETAVQIPEGMVAIRAPMVGTFYNSPRPGEPLFVEEGGVVEADTTVCLVEVMKMFNSVESATRGIVHKVLVRNGELVQHNQVLMLIAPLPA